MRPYLMPWGRVLRASLTSAAPPALALAALVALGHLGAAVAVFALLGVVGALFLITSARMAELGRLARHIDHLVRVPEATPPRFAVSETAREIARAVERLNRALEARRAAAARAAREVDSVLERLPDPLFVLDSERRIGRANAAAREMFGAALVGQDAAATLRNPALVEGLEAAARDGRARSVEFMLPQPVARTLLARIEPPAGAAGEDAPALILLLRDITAIKHSEEMRADFVANASHEIRTPLSSLIGFIETLRGPAKDDSEARAQFLELMEGQARRMARLVDDLLSLSRIEMREHTPPADAVALGDLLASVRSQLDWPARERGVTIVLDLAPNLPRVVGEAAELMQLFQNLALNAIKYGRKGGRVTLSARTTGAPPAGFRRPPGQEPSAVAVAVSDEGEGIPKEHIPRLTERFYRVDTARSREMGGTGLGLAIVKHIVNRHRGLLTIESELGKGSRFTVYLRPAPPGA